MSSNKTIECEEFYHLMQNYRHADRSFCTPEDTVDAYLAVIIYVDTRLIRVSQEIDNLHSQVKHWKSNHADVVSRLAIATQRPDLPVDRIPAIKELEALRQRVSDLEKSRNYASMAADAEAKFANELKAERDRLQSEFYGLLFAVVINPIKDYD